MLMRICVGSSLIVFVAFAVVWFPDHLNLDRLRPYSTDEAPAQYVGGQQCASCHPAAWQLWRGSHHDWAMTVATDNTVLADFDDVLFEHQETTSRFYRRDGAFMVHTEGSQGEMADYAISHTFGVEPLQQYLVPFPGGRLQALPIAWDTERAEWFHLNQDVRIAADNWLHWTRGGQNWNGMCAECHSTNLIKGYDATADSFATTWSQINVSCEACHGPASKHVEWAQLEATHRAADSTYGLALVATTLAAREQVELCAPCHSRRTQIGENQHDESAMMQQFVPAILSEPLYHADGQIRDEVYVYGSFLQSEMYANDVGCSDCHDPHSLQLVAEGNALCLQCHAAEDFDTYDHHFHEMSLDGVPNDGASCVKCHMPEQLFMAVDWRSDSFNHDATNFPLRGAHFDVDCLSCHADGFVNTPTQCVSCHANDEPKDHFGPDCAACHTDAAWTPSTFDHELLFPIQRGNHRK